MLPIIRDNNAPDEQIQLQRREPFSSRLPHPLHFLRDGLLGALPCIDRAIVVHLDMQANDVGLAISNCEQAFRKCICI